MKPVASRKITNKMRFKLNIIITSIEVYCKLKQKSIERSWENGRWRFRVEDEFLHGAFRN